jgi:Protein of unknown function (DUF2892)
VRLVAGTLVLTSVLIGIAVPPVTYLAAAVGAGLAVAALTNTCAMGALLAKLPYNRSTTCTPRALIDQLTTAQAPQQEKKTP